MRLFFLTCIFFTNLLVANIDSYLPPLTGRVVDNANILSIQTIRILEQIIKTEESNSSNQIVVATVKSLHQHSIEEFSIALARKWKIGQKKKNNGVLLLVAPNEHKVRIEVGYGLEGALTDKISHKIIEYTILPYFKVGNFNTGILRATIKIIDVISGEYKAPSKTKHNKVLDIIPFLFIFFGFGSITLSIIFKSDTLRTFGFSTFLSTFSLPITFSLFGTSVFTPYIIFLFLFIVIFILANAKFDEPNGSDNFGYTGGFNRGSYGGSFGGSTGGFSGGGGSFGGGGASGGW